MEEKKSIKQIYLTDFSSEEQNSKEIQDNLQLDEISFFVHKSQNAQNLLMQIQRYCQLLQNLKSISICILANIFIGQRGIEIIFETLKNMKALQHLKLKIDQGNQFGQNNGKALIEGLNELKGLISLNLKLNVFNNAKQQESDIIGKCFGELTQLESLSLTIYRYQGERKMYSEVINSIKNLVNLQSLRLKIKDSYLKTFDLYNLLNFENTNLPNLQEFSLSCSKDNKFKSPSSDVLEQFLKVVKLDDNFLVFKGHQKFFVFIGIFQQIHYFKNVKRLSIELGKSLPNHFIGLALDLLKDFQNVIFPELKINLDYFESLEDLTKLIKKLVAFQGIQELELNIESEFQILEYYSILRELSKLKNLQKISFQVQSILEIDYDEESEEDEFQTDEDEEEEEKQKISKEETEEQKEETIKSNEAIDEQKQQENGNEQSMQIDQIEYQSQSKSKEKKSKKVDQEVNTIKQIPESHNKEQESNKGIEIQKEEKKEEKMQQIEGEIETNLTQKKIFKQSFQDISDIIHFYSKLKESNFTIKSYELDKTFKQISLNQFLSKIKSIKHLKIKYTNDNYEDEDEEIHKKIYFDRFKGPDNLKVLKIDFYSSHLEFDKINLFKIIQNLQKLESFSLKFNSSEVKLCQNEILTLKETLFSLSHLKQLHFNFSIEVSENHSEIQTLFEGFKQLTLDKFKFSIPEITLDRHSSQYFASQIGNLSVSKIFQLSVHTTNQFFYEGTDIFLNNLLNFKQITKLELKFQKDNIHKEQVQKIVSQLVHLNQLENLNLIFSFTKINVEDIKSIKNSLKQLQQLKELNFCIDSFLVFYLINLHQDLPFLYLFSSQYFQIKFKRNGLNRIKFTKQEADNLKNQNKSSELVNQKFVQKNFEIMRIKIELKSLIFQNQIEDKWGLQNMDIPLLIELQLKQQVPSDSNKLINFLKFFKQYQRIRYLKFNLPKKLMSKPYLKNMLAIFFKIKYLVEFKQLYF